MLRSLIVLILFLNSSVSYAITCAEKFAELVPALKNTQFKETGKSEKEYWSSAAAARDEKLYRSNLFAQLSGEAWGSNTITSIAKSDGPQGENTLYRKSNNSAVLMTGIGQSKPTVIKFDNVTCDVKSVRFYNMKKTPMIAEDYQQLAYVDPKFCSFIEKHGGALALLPKDFDLYRCEELNCGQWNQQYSSCSCPGTKRPMQGPCCAGGEQKENRLTKLQDEYQDTDPAIDWESLSSELVNESRKVCKKWTTLFKTASSEVKGKAVSK